MPPRKHCLRPLSLLEEETYAAMMIHIGADGSLVKTDEVVFDLDEGRFGRLSIDYHHDGLWCVVASTTPKSEQS